MRAMLLTIAAFLAASFSPAIFFILSGPLFFFALAISTAHALVLGAPLFFLVKRRFGITFLSSAVSGVVAACIPISIWSWPLRYSELKSSSSEWDGEKMVQTMIDGIPTLAGWLSYVKAVAFFGLFGLVGGVAFWLVWRYAGPNKTLQSPASQAGTVGSDAASGP